MALRRLLAGCPPLGRSLLEREQCLEHRGRHLAGAAHERVDVTALDRASAAALDHTGGGRVTETEAGDEESYYEVEVTRADGSQVDVQLDRDFRVVGSEGDDDRGEDEGQD